VAVLRHRGGDLSARARDKVECLVRASVGPADAALDFGCGIGNVTCRLVERFHAVHGFEPSAASAEVARHRAPGARIESDLARIPDAGFAVAVLSGVLHHIPPADRRGALAQVLQKLAPGGRLFVFEHNPLNPLTRRAVSRCPFDDDAVLLWPRDARKLLHDGGIRRGQPRLHRLLPALARVPAAVRAMAVLSSLGGQTLLIASKPVIPTASASS
jgi:Methylase involved in ubiquinone/menaquinone biosynthesis